MQWSDFAREDMFSDKRILITGAGSGIGQALAIQLSKIGAKIVLVGRSEDKLVNTQKQLSGDGHMVIPYDLCIFGSYDSLFRSIAECGKLDGLVHCAGIAKPIPLRTLSEEMMDSVMDINYKSFVFLVKHFVKPANSNSDAAIVFCSAINAHLHQQTCMEIYEASKLAAEGFVKGIAAEIYSKRHIRINSLVIGPVATPMAGVEAASIGAAADLCPNLVGIESPDDIANAAIYLLSDLSKCTIGRNLYVDGGVALNVPGE